MMAASYNEIKNWVERGFIRGCTHVVVVCDTYDWSDYPVFVSKDQDIHEIIREHTGNMQRIMEVYNMSLPLGEQLSERRAYHI